MSADPRNVDRSDPVIAAVREWSAEARTRETAHPTPDVLLAYHHRQLADAEAEALREHLALCTECARRALDLAALSGRELPEGEARSSARAADAWPGTRRALAAEGLLRASHPAPVEASRFRRLSLFGPRLAYAAAAVFLLTSVGLSLRLAEAGRTLAELEQARANVVLVDLHPLAAGAQRADDLPPPRAAAAGEYLVLILHLLDPGTFDRYRAQILDQEGRTVWSTESLRRTPETDFTVLLPRRLLAGGRYRVRLHGLDGERAELLAEYDLRLAQPR